MLTVSYIFAKADMQAQFQWNDIPEAVVSGYQAETDKLYRTGKSVEVLLKQEKEIYNRYFEPYGFKK